VEAEARAAAAAGSAAEAPAVDRTMSSPVFDALNEPQADAVEHVNGPLLVFAGAGSGKTRVITYRIANLVACSRVPPYRILAVTFTNKAAGEMRSRLEKLLTPEIARDVWAGTFHATCAKLLRRHGQAVGLGRDFVIYDSSDQKQVVIRALRDLELDEKRYPPRAALARIHKEKQEARGPDEMSVEGYQDEAWAKVYRRYEQQLRAANAVDFEDLILYVLRILEDGGAPGSEASAAKPASADASAIRRRFDYVLVDEFQDTNATQYRLLRALTKEHRNLCVVGDDDQSIYRWRGADVRNIRGFRHDFPEAKVVKLEQNYRSTARIVQAALAVIEPSRERVPKELWTANEPGAAIEVVATKDERDEAAYVVRMIQEARAGGVDPKEIAVFYRVHAQSRVLEEALRASNLPYQIVGGMKFYERAEVKDALSYLRVLTNPRSDVDLLRIINVPGRGIGSTTLERLAQLATALGISVHEALARLDQAPEIASAARKRLTGVYDLLAKLREEALSSSPHAVLESVLERTGYRAALEEENSTESAARLENLGELMSSVSDYEMEARASGEEPNLSGYLERVSLQSDVDGMKDAPRVTLMTVHGAKGLEFELVLLTGMEEEMFPYRGMDPGGEEEMEEERRLAYVAITRARKYLVMTHAELRQIFGTTRWGRPSRFLADLPAEAIVQKTTRAASQRLDPYVQRASHAPQSQGSAWRHPQSPPSDFEGASSPSSRPRPPPSPSREPGERFVDREFFDDDSGKSQASDAPIGRGTRVFHARFGEGEVRRVEASADPTVVAFFPGWGEKKILARFLKLV
jgi:DNA helicase II / ATP-dependent DNA helicase PcrA